MISVSLALALVFGLFLLTAILDPGGHDYLILALLALAPLLLFIWASAFRMERRRVTQAESEYETQLLLSDGVFNHTIEGIAITDIKGNIERVNPAFTRITGYAAEETVGKNPRILKCVSHDFAVFPVSIKLI